MAQPSLNILDVPSSAMEQCGYAVTQPVEENVRQAAFPDHPPKVHRDRIGRQRSSVRTHAHISTVHIGSPKKRLLFCTHFRYSAMEAVSGRVRQLLRVFVASA